VCQVYQRYTASIVIKSLRNTSIYIVLSLGVVVVSFAPILIRLAEAPVLSIASFRLGIAAIILGPIALIKERSILTSLSHADILLTVVSGLALAAHFGFWIASLSYTSITSSTVLVTANPIFVALCSHYFLRERVEQRVKIAIMTILIGMAIIYGGDFSLGERSLFGNVLALIGALWVAIYYIIGQRLRSRMSVTSYVGLVYTFAAVTILIVSVISGTELSGFSTKTYLWLLLLALGPQVIGHTSLNWVLGYLGATVVAVAVMAEPVLASILALIIFNEVPTVANIIGGLIVLSGVYVVVRYHR
jgi:drug/metabolite transporter (DMT)-like permease